MPDTDDLQRLLDLEKIATQAAKNAMSQDNNDKRSDKDKQSESRSKPTEENDKRDKQDDRQQVSKSAEKRSESHSDSRNDSRRSDRPSGSESSSQQPPIRAVRSETVTTRTYTQSEAREIRRKAELYDKMCREKEAAEKEAAAQKTSVSTSFCMQPRHSFVCCCRSESVMMWTMKDTRKLASQE